MAQVNPVPLRVPQKIAGDPELRGFFEELIKTVYQERERTGGSDDFILSSRYEVETQDSRRMPEIRELTQKMNALELQLSQMNVMNKQITDKLNELELS